MNSINQDSNVPNQKLDAALDVLWQELAPQGDEYDIEFERDSCVSYLYKMFSGNPVTLGLLQLITAPSADRGITASLALQDHEQCVAVRDASHELLESVQAWAERAAEQMPAPVGQVPWPLGALDFYILTSRLELASLLATEKLETFTMVQQPPASGWDLQGAVARSGAAPKSTGSSYRPTPPVARWLTTQWQRVADSIRNFSLGDVPEPAPVGRFGVVNIAPRSADVSDGNEAEKRVPVGKGYVALRDLMPDPVEAGPGLADAQLEIDVVQIQSPLGQRSRFVIAVRLVETMSVSHVVRVQFKSTSDSTQWQLVTAHTVRQYFALRASSVDDICARARIGFTTSASREP